MGAENKKPPSAAELIVSHPTLSSPCSSFAMEEKGMEKEKLRCQAHGGRRSLQKRRREQREGGRVERAMAG